MAGSGSPWRNVAAALVALLATGCAVAGPASAAQAGAATLSSATQAVTWSGSNPNPTTTGYFLPADPSCTFSTCFDLNVQLPPGIFTSPGDGVLVSIKWATDFDQWNLYVYGPDGSLVGHGNDVDSNGQSVLLKLPANGVYRIEAAAFYTTFPQDLTFKAEARVYHAITDGPAAGTQLLPQLRTTAPSNFEIGGIPPVPSNPTGWRWTPPGTFTNSCYTDETVDNGSTRCLRFDNDIQNVGSGPLILRFKFDPQAFGSAVTDSGCQMQQEIVVVDQPSIDRSAGPCVFHPSHAHFHYEHMALYQLYRVGTSGKPAATPISTSHKVGYCAIDVDDWAFGTSGDQPRAYSFPTCNVPNSVDAHNQAAWEYMGISPGWGDVYTWDLPDQYIDVSHVPNGVYEVVSRANPDGALLESSGATNTGVTCIAISGNKVTTIASYPSQPNSAPLPACHRRPGIR